MALILYKMDASWMMTTLNFEKQEHMGIAKY